MEDRLTVVGGGLIGMSFVRAARHLFERVCVVEPDAGHARVIIERGLADEVVDAVPAEGAVLLACPVDAIVGWVVRLSRHPDVVFDVGSVKGSVMAGIERQLGRLPPHYVPCHPIAGRERSGPDAAEAALFRDQLVLLTPGPDTDPDCIDRVAGWWQAIGARVQRMDAAEHDSVYALTSHLPHLLAFAYLQSIEPAHLEHTGGGFRDFSRIGESDPDMWTAVFDSNRQALLSELAAFSDHLEVFREALAAGDTDRCRALIAAAGARRRGAPEGRLPEGDLP